ncbi:MAG: helix-turn-helix domain-containing protein, partial [Telluria sp.]
VEVKDMPFELTAAQEGTSPVSAAPALPGEVAPPGVTLAALETSGGWIALLELEAAGMLAAGQSGISDVLGRQFESALIKTALRHTHGRKNDAAVRLGIGRNTITRKIAELGIDGAKDE